MRTPRVPRRLVGAVVLGTLLNPLNSSMIAVALTRIQGDFHVTVGEVTWLISGFFLAAAMGQPLMGRLADLFGPRRVFITGLGLVFATASWHRWFQDSAGWSPSTPFRPSEPRLPTRQAWP